MGFEDAASIFDRYIDWDRRLAREMPYLISRLKDRGCSQVVDVACGCGMHAAALAEAGFAVTAIDPDPVLLEKAGALAEEKGLSLRFERMAFSDLPGPFSSRFDGAVCMGNSISLAAPGRKLVEALAGISHILQPGGCLLLHTLNYPMLGERPDDPWGPVRTLEDGSFMLKGFLRRTQGPWDALFISLVKDPEAGWRCRPFRFTVHPYTPAEITGAAAEAGLVLKSLSGGFAGEPTNEAGSADLVYELICERTT